LVTGGAGFIGSHAVDNLRSRGLRVRIVDNLSGGRLSNLAQHENDEEVQFTEADIQSLDSNSSVFREVDFILHFAGIGDIVPSVERPADYMDTNVMGTVRMLEGARAAGVRRIVYAASSSCYGSNPPLPTREDSPISPEYPYALSKNLGEQAAFHWAQVYGLGVNSIRIFNAYGTRSRTSGAYGAVFGVFLRQKLAGVPFTVVGDGTQSRDFVYVTDVAEAFVRAGLTDIEGRIWNLGSNAPHSVNRLIELLEGSVVHLPMRPGEPDTTWADTRRIIEDLDWRPEISFEEGVSRVLANIDYWADAPLWDADSIDRATRMWFTLLESQEEIRP
jgi:UDP-glucose 4-epimerase